MTNERIITRLNTLEKLAGDYAEKNMDINDIKGQDITAVLFAVLESIIKNKELINVAIVGYQTRGKSALAAFLMWWVNEYLGIETTINHIAGDEIEFTRKVMEKEASHVAIMTDEINQLNKTGYNSTTEEAIQQWYSEVCAQYYVHRFACSPLRISDETSQIVLTMLERREETQEAICEVHYRILRAGTSLLQYVGRAKICIAEILNKPWYKEYRQKKFKKMELVTRVGVRDIRELEWADVVLETYKELDPIAEYTSIKKDVILNVVGGKRRQLKQFHSIVLDQEIVARVNGLLVQKREIGNGKYRLSKLIQINQKKPNARTSAEVYALKAYLQKMQTILKNMLQEEKEKVQAMKEYYGAK